jgi:hypothetical protein
MRKLSFIVALLLANIAAVSAAAVDLTKIDRTIAKEPAYKAKPKYCLLVFGPEAKMRVWLVLDGDVLYVDRNGNGDLTEKGERVADPDSAYEPGDITEPGGQTKHTGLLVKREKDGMVISCRTEGKYRQRTGHVVFAGRSQEAPIIHFNGPVSVRFSSAEAQTDGGKVGSPAVDLSPKERLLQQLGKDIPLPGERRPNRIVSLGAVLGTPGLGEGTFATYKAREILGQPNERIVVEAAFPHQDAEAEPIRVQGFLQRDS